MSTIIQRKAIPLRCHRCLHKWNYGGNNFYVATCPHCRIYVNIKKNIIKYGEKNQEIKRSTIRKKFDSSDDTSSKNSSNESPNT
jgi:hypothetical protein